MRIVRFAVDGRAKYGLLEGSIIHSLRGSPFARFKGPGSAFAVPDGNTCNLAEARLLAPCLPSKLVCLGLNYRRHIPELQMREPAAPLIFLKPSTAVIGPGENIVRPGFSRRVDYEGELGVVIGRKARNIPESNARECVIGYTCFNDVTERDNQKEDIQWTRAKSYDTFAPVGPWIETDVNPDALKIETRLNGELRQSASTADLIFGISRVISFISGVMTLLPGDIIATGTPSGVGNMNPGDVVEVRIEGVGALRNYVIGERKPSGG